MFWSSHYIMVAFMCFYPFWLMVAHCHVRGFCVSVVGMQEYEWLVSRFECFRLNWFKLRKGAEPIWIQLQQGALLYDLTHSGLTEIANPTLYISNCNESCISRNDWESISIYSFLQSPNRIYIFISPRTWYHIPIASCFHFGRPGTWFIFMVPYIYNYSILSSS